MASSFERDFGYLVPFMERVEQAASTLPDASARAELTALMREEKARWARIRELLAGGAGRGAGAQPAAVVPTRTGEDGGAPLGATSGTSRRADRRLAPGPRAASGTLSRWRRPVARAVRRPPAAKFGA